MTSATASGIGVGCQKRRSISTRTSSSSLPDHAELRNSAGKSAVDQQRTGSAHGLTLGTSAPADEPAARPRDRAGGRADDTGVGAEPAGRAFADAQGRRFVRAGGEGGLSEALPRERS